MSESRTTSSIKNATSSIITQVFTIILNYVCRYIFVRTLSEEYLGVNGLFSNILTIFSLAELGIGSAIVYAMYKPIATHNEEKIRAYVGFYKKCYNTIALVVLILGLCFLPFLNFFINQDSSANINNLSIIYLLYLLDSVFSYLCIYKSSILIAMQKNYICNYFQIIGKFIMSIFMSLSLIIYKNFLIYLIIQVICKLLINISISIKANEMYPYIKNTHNAKISKQEKRNIFKNVYALFCNQIGSILINGTDNIIISKYVSLIAVGLYSNYYLVISALTVSLSQMFSAIISSIGNLSVNGNNEKIYTTFNKVNFINFVVVSLCTVLLFCCINTFIQLSFGGKYLLDNFTVLIILINFYFTVIKCSIPTFKYGLGIFWNDKYSTLIRAIINVITSIIFVKLFGLVGVFLGTLVSDLLTTFWYQPYALYKYGFKKRIINYFKDFIKYTFITVLEVSLCLFIINVVSIPNRLIMLVVELLIGILVTTSITIVIFRKNENYIYIKNIILSYIKKFKYKLGKDELYVKRKKEQ